MPSAYGARLTTFEDSEKESECGYVRKVSLPIYIFHSSPAIQLHGSLTFRSIGLTFFGFLSWSPRIHLDTTINNHSLRFIDFEFWLDFFPLFICSKLQSITIRCHLDFDIVCTGLTWFNDPVVHALRRTNALKFFVNPLSMSIWSPGLLCTVIYV